MCDKCLDKTVEALKKFNFKGDIIRVTPFGSGIINDTFLVVCNDKGSKNKYILQRINNSVFKNVNKLMENYCNVCDYLKDIICKRGGDIDRQTITVVLTNDGKSFVIPRGITGELLNLLRTQ